MCFSKNFEGANPLSHIGKKLLVYLRLLELCQKQGWEVYVLTRKTYQGHGLFNGGWLFNNGEFDKVDKLIKIDIVFDWVGGLLFPPKNDKDLKVVNTREFKELASDKWKTYQILHDYMPGTFWVGELKNAPDLVDKIKTDIIVVKPFDGLRGKDIYIGTKEKLKYFKPEKLGKKYIIQEFIDTTNGIPNLTEGRHDLRIVVINGKVVWCHVRVPSSGSYLANAARGGNLTEIDYSKVPKSIKNAVGTISKDFYEKYDNPLFSLDFGIGIDGRAYIFEINDQIGFPRWEMKNRDIFLNELVNNFSSKI